MERLISNTHAPTHNTWKLKVKSVFKCDRQGEAERFNKEMDNRMLLWHGSRLVSDGSPRHCRWYSRVHHTSVLISKSTKE